VTLPPEQDGFAYRFGWGPDGLAALAPAAAVVVIVDVLRFASAVSAAVEAGACVIPARWADEQAAAFAASSDAILAGRREDGGPSLSPTDLLTLRPGTRVVLPSPNGATLTAAARDHGPATVLAGCLRNASATARRAHQLAAGGPIAVIASGERTASGAIRPAVEDLLGAGAVLRGLDPAGAVTPPRCSPDAAAARAAFVAARPLVVEQLLDSTSGRQLADWGWSDDVHTSAAVDVTDLAAQLVDGAYVAV
jgi:2-phosphosulfolactate phosphatase